MSAEDGQLLTTIQAAELLHVHPKTIAQWTKGKLLTAAVPGSRGRGRSALFRREDLLLVLRPDRGPRLRPRVRICIRCNVVLGDERLLQLAERNRVNARHDRDGGYRIGREPVTCELHERLTPFEYGSMFGGPTRQSLEAYSPRVAAEVEQQPTEYWAEEWDMEEELAEQELLSLAIREAELDGDEVDDVESA